MKVDLSRLLETGFHFPSSTEEGKTCDSRVSPVILLHRPISKNLTLGYRGQKCHLDAATHRNVEIHRKLGFANSANEKEVGGEGHAERSEAGK